MVDMLVKLYNLPESGPLVQKMGGMGICIRPAMAHERRDVVDWVLKRFGRGWAGECETAFSRQPVSCFIAEERGTILGFSCHEVTCQNFFGPMGVGEKHRKKGIGKALLLSSLHAMRAKGYAYAVIGGAGSLDFYEKTVKAVPIEGSSPGIYPRPLKG